MEKMFIGFLKDLKSFTNNLYVYKDEDDSFVPINKLYDGSNDEIKNYWNQTGKLNAQDEINKH